MESVIEECNELAKEFDELQKRHTQYAKIISQVKDEQTKCLNGIAHQRHCMKRISETMRKLPAGANEADKKKFADIHDNFQIKKNSIRDMEETLPRKNGWYLSIVLGQVNVSLLSKEDKFAYKNDYERFKLVVTSIAMVLSFLLYFFIRSRMMDAVYHFLLVWYYCTLTIRERILITNGSRIKGWWLTYHFISTVEASILLIWPKSESYDTFRDYFMLYSLYIHFVELIQYYYQKGCLYKLRALGESHNMDITVDGFMSWMFKHLTFLLPVLFLAYAFQFLTSYKLYRIAHEEYCREWQVLVLAGIFLLLAGGNTITALGVIRQKLVLKYKTGLMERLETKYRFGIFQKSVD